MRTLGRFSCIQEIRWYDCWYQRSRVGIIPFGRRSPLMSLTDMKCRNAKPGPPLGRFLMGAGFSYGCSRRAHACGGLPTGSPASKSFSRLKSTPPFPLQTHDKGAMPQSGCLPSDRSIRGEEAGEGDPKRGGRHLRCDRGGISFEAEARRSRRHDHYKNRVVALFRLYDARQPIHQGNWRARHSTGAAGRRNARATRVGPSASVNDRKCVSLCSGNRAR